MILADHLEIEGVSKPDFDDAEAHLRDKGVIRRTETGVTVDKERKAELVSAIEEDHRLKYELYEQILTPVSLEAVETGECIFVVPGVENVYLLFLFPDQYVAVPELREFYVTLELMVDLRQDNSDTGNALK